ncbi:MAG: glycosyltransferase [Lachnospiraceae bacterium]|nr:glycosyltransferase [Lachnospiraceae bacterium]
MKLLIPDWKSFGKEDIADALTHLGHEFIYYSEEPRNYRRDPKFRSGLRRTIREQGIDAIFSSNYYPVLSAACQETGIPYLSWCYDSPLVLTYSDTVFNSCNYLFLFDSQMVTELKNLGVQHCYYLPMAANCKRLDALKATREQQKLLDADVSFVGSLYNEKHNLFDRFADLDDYTKGYLEGIMQAQRMVYGCFFLEDTLTPEIISKLQKTVPLEVNRDGHETLAYLYSNYFLCRKMTQTDRKEILESLENRKDLSVKLYTPGATPMYSHIRNMGTVQYQNEMPLVFRHSRINLNITLRSIQNGIPLRAMDIMGAGGFLLTNYQNDFGLHFTDGEDYVCYNSLEDLQDKITYYLNHEEERKEIARRGHRKVAEEHSYIQRLQEMFSVLV